MKVERRVYLLTSIIVLGLSFSVVRLMSVAARHAPFLNLDFESIRDLPYGWLLVGAGFQFTLDESGARSGDRSLRIENIGSAPNSLATASQAFPIDLVRGRRVRVSGWIRTERVEGATGIWWRVDGPRGTISLDNAPPPGLPPGDTGWTRYEFERVISPEGTDVHWGVFLRGGGTAWFDRLEIFIDDMPLEQDPPPL